MHKIPQTTSSQEMSFRGLRHLLLHGNSEVLAERLAGATLLPAQRTYLRVWMLCQELAWEEAAGVLAQAGADLLSTERQQITVRRLRPWVLWRLGNLAREVRGTECVSHYARALTMLDERRMNIPWLRIQVLADLAQALMVQGLEGEAQLHYETALALCLEQAASHPARAEIYQGLCHIAANHEATHDQAVQYAHQALACLPPDAGEARAQALFALGRLSTDQHDAHTYYADALALTQDASLQGRLLLAQACLSPTPEEAWPLCLRALDLETLPPPLRASIALFCAHLKQDAWEEAVFWGLKAVAFSPTAETLSALGKRLESILEQEPTQVELPYWRDAYHRLIQGIAPLSSREG